MSAAACHPATLETGVLLEQCEVSRSRRSGPGGQHRNKVETAIVLTHRPTGIKAEATERRSQAQNHGVAVFRLRKNLALRIRMPVNRTRQPSALWQSRCRGGKLSVSPRHADFPSILAESLDVIVDAQFDLKAAARHLGCSTSQLVKLLKAEPRAMTLVNQHRQEAGMHVLK